MALSTTRKLYRPWHIGLISELRENRFMPEIRIIEVGGRVFLVPVWPCKRKQRSA